MKKSIRYILYASLILNIAIIYVGFKALEYRNHINEFLEKYTYVIDEFSGRNSYLLENRNLNADSTVSGRVIFIGTQLTYNWELSKYFPQTEAINRGISGQRFSGYLLRFQSDVINLAPQAVVIEFSSYNFRPESHIEEFMEYTKSLTELAKINNIVPILTTVLPVGSDFDVEFETQYEVADSIKVFNTWLRNYCENNKISYVDYYSLMADESGHFDKRYLGNQIQPNQEGYFILSQKVHKTFQTIGVSLNATPQS